MENYTQKSTLLISTHLINDLESAFTHALFLGNGKILADAPVDVLTQGGQKHIEDVFKEVFFNVW
jgi:ABC-2 type transport system ATP-binding protein